MNNELEPNKSHLSTPTLIYVVCVIGFAATLPILLSWTTEVAHAVGKWYKNFLILSSFSAWIALVGIWYMKKWAVITYSVIGAVTQIILFKYNMLWNFTPLIVSFIVASIAWFYFSKMR